MNKFQKKFEELKQAIIDTCLPGFQQQHGDNIYIEFIVHDPIHCRTFELDTYFEFSEWEFQDLNALDFYLEVNCMRRRGYQSQLISRYVNGRITSYPGSPNMASITDLNLHIPSVKPFVSLLEFIASCMRIQGLVMNVYGRQEMKTEIEHLGFSMFASLPWPGRDRLQYFLYKKL